MNKLIMRIAVPKKSKLVCVELVWYYIPMREFLFFSMTSILLVLFSFNLYPEYISPDNEIVFYTSRNNLFFRETADLFKEKTGINVVIVNCSVDAYLRKVVRESSLEEGTIDCLLVNNYNHFPFLIRGGVSFNNQTIVNDSKLVVSEQELHGFLPLFINRMGFLYDSSVLKNPPFVWDDFTNWINRNKSNFGFPAQNGETGISFRYSVLATLTGGGGKYSSGDKSMIPYKTWNWNRLWRWFGNNHDNFLYTSSDYESIRLLSSGKLLLTVAYESEVITAIEEGALSSSVKMYIPEFGCISSVEGVVIPANSGRQQEARKFLAFLISPEIQDLMQGKYNMLSVLKGLEPLEGALIKGSDIIDYSLKSPDFPYLIGLEEGFREYVLFR